MKLTSTCSACAVFAAALMLAGCADGPDDVALKFIKDVANGSFDKATELASNDTKPLVALMAGMMDEETKADMKGASFKVLSTKVDGNTAKVTIQSTDKDGEVDTDDIDLVKENGDWKVAITK